MSKKKSVFVTVILALMLVIIAAGLYTLKANVWFCLIVGVFAVYGFSVCAVNFCDWMMEKPKQTLDPVVISDNDDDNISATIDEIMEEVRDCE